MREKIGKILVDNNLRTDQRVISQIIKEFEELIDGYSSSAGRAENEHERGISRGIEMFRSYLKRKL